MKSANLNSIAAASALALILLFPNELAFTQDCPAPSFAAARASDAGWKPLSLAAGDFNGDGKADVAVANYGGGTITVLLGRGDGTFQTPISSNTGGGYSSRSVAASDFNRDGKLDLAVADSYTSKISVLLGNGDGTFQATATHYCVGRTPLFVTVGDFNGDAVADLVAANSGTNTISVLLGRGDGMFQTATHYDAGENPRSVRVSDFNGDGKPDLAVANCGSDNVSVLLGNGDGTLQSAINHGAGSRPYSLTAGDLNGDGNLDLVVANFADPYATTPAIGTVSVLLGRGDGSFQPARDHEESLGPHAVALGDFNGDAKLDMAIANNGGHPIKDARGLVSVRLGSGDGSFQAAVNYDAGWAPAFLAVDDFNGDGQPDLAVNGMGSGDLELVGGPVAVLLNTCAATPVHLAIVRTSSTLILSWPLPHANFFLESATIVGSTNWQRVVEAMITNNGHCEVPLPLNQSEHYFRLRKP